MLQPHDRIYYVLDVRLGKPSGGIGAEFGLDLRTRKPVSRRAQRLLATRREGLAADGLNVDKGRYAAQVRFGTHLDPLGEAAQFRIVVTFGLELGEREFAIVQDCGRDVVGGQQRLEFRFVFREISMQVKDWLAQRDA